MTTGFWFGSCLIYYRRINLGMRHTMKCHHVQREFSAYQDGELKPTEQEKVSRRLQDCHSCREQYEKIERVWQTLGELEEIRPDPWFYRQLLRKIEEPSERGFLPMIERFFGLLRTPAVASIVLAVGILTGTYLGNILVRRDFFPFLPERPGEPTLLGPHVRPEGCGAQQARG